MGKEVERGEEWSGGLRNGRQAHSNSPPAKTARYFIEYGFKWKRSRGCSLRGRQLNARVRLKQGSAHAETAYRQRVGVLEYVPRYVEDGMSSTAKVYDLPKNQNHGISLNSESKLPSPPAPFPVARI
jgi:hypothetical protein